MAHSEKAARLLALAGAFRNSAAQTCQPLYRDKMLKIAEDLEREAEDTAAPHCSDTSQGYCAHH